MRAVGANRKLELHQEFMRGWPVGVFRPAILCANLAEFARPVRQNCRLSGVVQRRVGGAIRPVVAGAGEPSPRELIIRRSVVAFAFLPAIELIALAPDELASSDERVIDRALQWPPAQRRI